jgi:hypothetical protein
VEYHGRVVKKPVALGTKSEREAVMLVTAKGEFVLRRQGGNAYKDPELDALVGKSIACDGTLHGYTVIMSEWREL